MGIRDVYESNGAHHESLQSGYGMASPNHIRWTPSQGSRSSPLPAVPGPHVDSLELAGEEALVR